MGLRPKGRIIVVAAPAASIALPGLVLGKSNDGSSGNGLRRTDEFKHGRLAGQDRPARCAGHVPNTHGSCPGLMKKPGEDTATWEAVCERPASGADPHCLPAVRASERDQSRVRSAMSGKGDAGNTPAQENEGVGEHVRTRFHIGPKAACEIAELTLENRTERRKLVSSAGP